MTTFGGGVDIPFTESAQFFLDWVRERIERIESEDLGQSQMWQGFIKANPALEEQVKAYLKKDPAKDKDVIAYHRKAEAQHRVRPYGRRVPPGSATSGPRPDLEY